MIMYTYNHSKENRKITMSRYIEFLDQRNFDY